LTVHSGQKSGDLRAARSQRAKHRQCLDELHAQGDLLLAGPWSDDSGALLIFSADGNRVQQIIQDDPYYSTPGVTVLAVREWMPIAGDR